MKYSEKLSCRDKVYKSYEARKHKKTHLEMNEIENNKEIKSR